MTKKKLLISFSGGRTSAYMTWWLLNEWEDRHNWEIIIVFANTGKEHEKTLEFVERCSVEWGIPIYWVEAKHLDENGKPWSKRGWQVKHKVVDFETASRKGEPFEEMISVHGIPSTNVPFCSEQLKKLTIKNFLSELGWKKYTIAIGIRLDEVDRVNEKFRESDLIYPLISLHPTTRARVVIWWQSQPFDLEVPEDLGNCDGCWKKDNDRLIRIAKKTPQVLGWWQEMTDRYAHFMPREMKEGFSPPFNFYRGNLSPKDFLKLAKLKPDQLKLFIEDKVQNSCSESCEAF